ncbi:unnamed protein product, partial [Staurois parvus]
MSPLQHPRPSPPASAGIRLLGSLPCEGRDVWGTEPAGNSNILIKSHSITLLYQAISHTFCPECFVLCPACIFTVLSAWKLREVHGVQKKRPFRSKAVLDQLENSDSKLEILEEL